MGLIPGLGRSLEKGAMALSIHADHMDRGAWWSLTSPWGSQEVTWIRLGDLALMQTYNSNTKLC